MLQLASAKLWGDKEFNKLDKISVALPHPDAAAAIIKGGTEITGALRQSAVPGAGARGQPERAHRARTRYEVLGGPASATVLYATEKFRSENPKTYKAFVDALAEAAKFVTANPEQAADIYLKVSNAKLDRELLLKIIKNPEVQFKTTPQNTYPLAEFMHRVGAIKNKPASVKDYFFDDAQNRRRN